MSNANTSTEQYDLVVIGSGAAGDVAGFPSLASVPMEQGRVAVCHAFHQPAVFVAQEATV
jgi:pyruvate/2-oxoglutarate dehydrogenase complex dihydrolipoamide dehydrogenase (E3) component